MTFHSHWCYIYKNRLDVMGTDSWMLFKISAYTTDIMRHEDWYTWLNDGVWLQPRRLGKFKCPVWSCWIAGQLKLSVFLIFHGATAPNVPRPPHYRVFTPTLSRTILGDSPPDEWSARRRLLPDNTQHSRRESNPQPQQASGCRPTP